MHRAKKQQQRNKGKLTVLALALSGALAAIAPAHAQTNTIVAGTYTSQQNWTSNDLVVDNGAFVNVAGITGMVASGILGTLTNHGTISGALVGFYNNRGSITAINNYGTINGNSNGIAIDIGTIGALTNNGVIGGVGVSGVGIFNNGRIGTLTNSGAIGGVSIAISNLGTITTLTNNSNSTISGDNGISNNSGGTITTLTNNGTISGGFAAIVNEGAISTLTNNGTIGGGNTGISNSGTISTLINNGTISGGASDGITNYNGGLISTLTNNGTISATGPGIYNDGTISTLNNSGTIISPQYAIYNNTDGSIGPITNSGVIAGNIENASSNVLSISGGAGTIVGTLTGFGSVNNIGGIGADNIGTISNTASDLAFTAGNLLLNDNIDVTGHTVTNSGATLQVNNTISITGNYVQNAGATLQIGVADGAQATGTVSTDSGYGRLVVSGSATFDAGSSVALKTLNTYAFAQGQRFVVVQASDAHYNDSGLNYSAIGYNGTVTGASVVDTDNAANTDLVLTVGALNPAPPSNQTAPTGPTTPPAPINSATDATAVSSLTGLFNYTGTNAGMLNLFNAAAATGGTGDSGEANRAGAQLSPASTGTALVQSVQVATQAVIDVTSAHIDMVRVAQASGSGDSGVATGERPGDVAVWGQAFGGQANQDDRGGGSGYRADYNGMLIGADTALNDQWRVGGLFSYANTSIANSGDNSGSSGHVSAYGLTGYAGYAAEKWYLDLSAGAVQQKYSTFRNVDFSGFNGGASGSFDGMQYIASAQAGYPIKLDDFTTVTPIAGVTYSKLRQDGYTETGSAAALQIGSASTSSIKSDLGAKLERSFKTSYGDMIPSAQLSWRHEYRNTGLQSVGNFAADTTGTTSFTTQGVDPEKDTGVLVLGVTLARSRNLTLAAHYTLEAAGGYNAQTADVRLRYQF
jgi:outer membrane autotransporter protein